MRSDFLVVGDNFELVVLSRIAPVAWLLLRLLQKKSEFQVVSLTIALTIYCPANCAGAIFASSKSMKTNFTMLSLGTSWMRRMFSAKCSAQFVLSHSTYPCSEGSILLCQRFHLLSAIKGAHGSLFSFCKFLNCSFASRYPVSAIDVVPICILRSLFLLFRRIAEDTEMDYVIQVPNLSIRPTKDKLRLPVNRIIWPSSRCVTSFEVMLLP